VVRKTLRGSLIVLAIWTLAGCGGSEEAAAKNGPMGEAKTAAAGDTAGAEGERGSPGRAGGRGAMSIVLGPNDVAEVKLGTIEQATAIQGDLRPIEEVPVRARIEGNVEAVYVREGDRVGRGQVMGRFESSNEESARKSAEADVASARSDLTNAQWNADQSAELFRAGAIPERDLRTAQQALVAAQARLAAAESRLRAASQDLNDTRIISPTNGVVSTRTVETGEHVTRGATIFTVVRNDILELEAAVPARFAGDVRPSMPVRFNAAGRNLTGRVARVSPTINPANRSITVYLQLPNPGGALKGNTFATGRIVARTVTGSIVVPTAAIRYSQQQAKPFVYRIASNVVEYQPVDLGIIDETAGIVQVVEGLQEGDRIIVGNVGAVGRGVRVRLADSPEQGRGKGAMPRP
jgi:RND family efflux transporter MFP subunit